MNDIRIPGPDGGVSWKQLALFGGAGLLIMSVGTAFLGNHPLLNVHNSVMIDAISSYEMAARNGGDEFDLHNKAALAAEAALMAKDEQEYRKWVKIRNTHARNIGLAVPSVEESVGPVDHALKAPVVAPPPPFKVKWKEPVGSGRGSGEFGPRPSRGQ